MNEEVHGEAVDAVATADLGNAGIGPGIVAAYVAGDGHAFRQLFEAFRQQIFAVVARYFRSPFDQEEALQEAWLQIYRARRAFDVNRHEAFVAWARQVARNRCLDLVKSRDRVREVPASESVDAVASGQGSAPDPLQRVVDERLRRAVEGFVSTLATEERRFFDLCFVQERPHEEIATILGINERRSKYLKKKLFARLLRHGPLRGERRA